MRLTNAELIHLLDALLPGKVAYHSFRREVELPYIVVYETAPRNMAADNRVHDTWRQRNLEVYSRDKDFALEARLEAWLNDQNIYWTKSDDIRTEEGIVEVVYSI